MMLRPTIDRGFCQQCQSRVLWIQMKRADGSMGKRMPVNPEWKVSEHGARRNLVVTDKENYGHMIPNAPPDTVGREAHAATCPAEIQARKKKARENEQRSLF